jgi:hypothetical protein
MFRPTDRQSTFGSLSVLLSPQKIARLRNGHWAGAFREKALPVLLAHEEAFRPLFCEDNGRPNKPVAALLGLLLLKEMFDLTDEVALDEFEFHNAWQYALNVEPDDAHVCQKTLHNFRTRMSAAEQEGIATFRLLFDRIVQAIVADLGLKIGRQRLDSTHIRSNMAVLSRLGLFTQQLTAFLKKLRKQHPKLFAALPAGMIQRYVEREGYFADSPSSEGRRRLAQCAADLWRLVDRFRGHRSVSGMPSYLRLARLLKEQCVIEDGPPTDPDGDGPEGVPVRPKDPGVEKIPATSLQGSDEDATYGHKGKGYQVQVAETCAAENPVEVVTHVEVEGAHVSDQQATIPTIDALAERGCPPEMLLADTNYGSGQNLVDAAARGVELLTPACGPEPVREPEMLLLEDFTFSADGSRLERCPAGAAPVDQGVVVGRRRLPVLKEGVDSPDGVVGALTQKGACPSEDAAGGVEDTARSRRYARMDADRCARCRHLACCVAQWDFTDETMVLQWTPAQAATALSRRRERTPAFKTAYRLRSGIEGTNSEYKRGHGGGVLRVRGSPAVRRTVHFKFMALNVKRWIGAARKAAKIAA